MTAIETEFEPNLSNNLAKASCTRRYFLQLWEQHSYIAALLIIFIILWMIGVSLFGFDSMGFDNQIIQLSVLFVLAKITGVIVSMLKVPPMVGMLLTGVFMKNFGLIKISGNYTKVVTILRQLALIHTMVPAGLGLDPKTLQNMKWMVFKLTILPVVAEVLGVTFAAYFLLKLPWLWGLLLGFLIAAVSSAVILPSLIKLKDKGYGVEKSIHSLVIASSTINDIACIALFSIVIGIIFNTEELYMKILHSPILISIGLSFGLTWSLICRYIPHQEEKYLITLRTILLDSGCILSAVGSAAIKYGSAGSLGCIATVLTTSTWWRRQGWDCENPVRKNFLLLWKFFEPISFGLIGIEVYFDRIDWKTVLLGTVCIILPLLVRIVTSCISLQSSNLSLKENIFVAISWVPKATVQAALGPVALDISRNIGDPILMKYASTVLLVVVLSIMITSPIGVVLVKWFGPRFLDQTPVTEKIHITEDNSGIKNENLHV